MFPSRVTDRVRQDNGPAEPSAWDPRRATEIEAARDVYLRKPDGFVYADVYTDSMRRAIDETNRRRRIQESYNDENGITPQSIIKPIDMSLVAIVEADYVTVPLEESPVERDGEVSPEERERLLLELEERMKDSARKFEFEKAAQYRDRLKALRLKIPHETSTPADADHIGTDAA